MVFTPPNELSNIGQFGIGTKKSNFSTVTLSCKGAQASQPRSSDSHLKP